MLRFMIKKKKQAESYSPIEDLERSLVLHSSSFGEMRSLGMSGLAAC
jgi:hypothetical protein